MQRPAFQPRSRDDILSPKVAAPIPDNAAKSAMNRVAGKQDHVASALEQLHLIGNYMADVSSYSSYEGSQNKEVNGSNNTGNYDVEESSSRVINSNSNRRRNSTSIANSTTDERINTLHNYAKVYADRAKIRENNEINKINSKRKSFINKISEKIVMKKELLEGETSEDRLSRSTGNIKDETQADINNKLTFQPTLAKSTNSIFMNSKFNQYSDSTSKIANVHNRSQKWIEDKNMKLRREKEFIEREAEKELTFRPCVSKRPSMTATTAVTMSVNTPINEDKSGATDQATEDALSLSARNILWMRKREERLQIERKIKEKDELKDCTFAPNTSQKTKQKKKIEKKDTVIHRSSSIPSPMFDTVFAGSIGTYDSLNEEEFLREYEDFLSNIS